MNRISKFASIVLIFILLCSCGDNSKMNSIIEEHSLYSDKADSLQDQSPESTSDEKEFSDISEYDVDLTTLNPNMVYAQVYDMVSDSEKYVGKSVKARGTFAYYKEDDGRELFAVIIKDATACCAQGIEFVLDGDYKYPDDYPELDAEITVTGKFNFYEENRFRYCQLLNARFEVNS